MFYLFFFTSWSQGWRKGEMEVTVFVDKPTDVQAFRNMGLDFEPASADGAAARTYVVPAEMEKIVNSGLRYKVTIADMNRHSVYIFNNNTPYIIKRLKKSFATDEIDIRTLINITATGIFIIVLQRIKYFDE